MEYQRQFHKTKVHIKLNSKLKNSIKNSSTPSNSTRSVNSWKCNCKHHHLLPQNPFLTCEQGLIGWVMYSEDSLLLKIYDMLSNRYVYNNFEIGKQLREMYRFQWHFVFSNYHLMYIALNPSTPLFSGETREDGEREEVRVFRDVHIRQVRHVLQEAAENHRYVRDLRTVLPSIRLQDRRYGWEWIWKGQRSILTRRGHYLLPITFITF